MTKDEIKKGRGRFGFSRLQWVEVALEVLETRGIEAVRVQSLAAKLRVNKSGFYWHFRDREELLQSLLSYWGDLEETPLLELENETDSSPEQSLLMLEDGVDRKGLSRLDSAIRQWAKSDERVAKVYQAKIDRRLKFVRSQFLKLGFSGDEAEMRARTFVAYASVEGDFFWDQTSEERAEMRAARLRMLIAS